MKKILFSIIALISMATTAKADGLVVADVGIQPGKTATVQVSLTSTGETYRAVLFSLALPTGISVVADEYGDLITAADANLAAAGYSVTANHLAAGSDRFAVMNTGDDTVIPTECGPLFSFTIEADEGLTPGDVLTATLSDIKLTDAYAVDHSIPNMTVQITVEDSRTILDETSEDAPDASNGSVNVRVKRTINAGSWSTICLPFAMTESQVKAVFGDDVELGDFTDYDTTKDNNENIIAINVNFDKVTAIEANHPYIIKVTNPVTEFTVDGVVIAPKANPCVEYDNGLTGKKRKVFGTFAGTYVADFDFYNEAENYPLFISQNKFYYATENTNHMKAFRAYFDFVDNLPEVEEAESRVFMHIGDKATGIRNINQTTDNRYYDLQGRRVSKPGKGLYVKDGRKMVVK